VIVSAGVIAASRLNAEDFRSRKNNFVSGSRLELLRERIVQSNRSRFQPERIATSQRRFSNASTAYRRTVRPLVPSARAILHGS